MQEAGKDVIAQELIAKECQDFILKNGTMQQDDLSALEENIRVKLTGRTPLYDISIPLHTHFHTDRNEARHMFLWPCHGPNGCCTVHLRPFTMHSINAELVAAVARLWC